MSKGRTRTESATSLKDESEGHTSNPRQLRGVWPMPSRAPRARRWHGFADQRQMLTVETASYWEGPDSERVRQVYSRLSSLPPADAAACLRCLTPLALQRKDGPEALELAELLVPKPLQLYERFRNFAICSPFFFPTSATSSGQAKKRLAPDLGLPCEVQHDPFSDQAWWWRGEAKQLCGEDPHSDFVRATQLSPARSYTPEQIAEQQDEDDDEEDRMTDSTCQPPAAPRRLQGSCLLLRVSTEREVGLDSFSRAKSFSWLVRGYQAFLSGSEGTRERTATKTRSR